MEPDDIRYNPATDHGHDFVYTQVSVTPIPQRRHILTAAAAQRPEDRWSAEDLWALEDCTSTVATRHLEGQTGMHAYIAGQDGETARLVTLVPRPLSERPYDNAYLRASEMRPLTDAQAARLPELTARLHGIVPEKQQQYIEDLARKVAQDIPSRTDLLRAYQRTSVTEVLAEYDARTAPAPGMDDLPASLKAARLNFPAHPQTATPQPPERQDVQPEPRGLTGPDPDHGIIR